MKIGSSTGYFNTEPSSEETQLVNYIFLRSYQYWRERVDKDFSNVFAQKVLTYVADDLELDITRGWYKFGICGMIQPDIPAISDDLTPPGTVEQDELDEAIDSVCEDLNVYKDPTYWRHKQYTDYDNEVYEHMLILEYGLSEKPLSDKNIKHLRALRDAFPEEGYMGQKCGDVMNAFCTMAIELLTNADEDDKELFAQVRDAFGSLRELTSEAYLYETVTGPNRDEVRGAISQGIGWDREEVLDTLKTLHSEVMILAKDIEDTTDAYRERRKESWNSALEEAEGDIKKATQIFDQQSA